MKLTERLQKVADFVPACSCVADIGTDHAYIPIYLVTEGRALWAIAADIHHGPAERARIHIRSHGLSDRIEVREGSGLVPFDYQEVQVAVIAGMGGKMIQDILVEGKEHADTIETFVLQPMNHISELRIWLAENGYRIEREGLAQEGQRLYEILVVVHGKMVVDDLLTAEIGVTKERRKDPLFPQFLKKIISKRNLILKQIEKDTIVERHRHKRALAVEEKRRLEALL